MHVPVYNRSKKQRYQLVGTRNTQGKVSLQARPIAKQPKISVQKSRQVEKVVA